MITISLLLIFLNCTVPAVISTQKPEFDWLLALIMFRDPLQPLSVITVRVHFDPSDIRPRYSNKSVYGHHPIL